MTALIDHAPDENPEELVEQYHDQLSEDEQAARALRALQSERWKAELDRQIAFHAAHGTRFSGTCETCNHRLDHEQDERQAALDLEAEIASLPNLNRERDCVCGRLVWGGPDAMCSRCERDGYSL